MAYAARIMQYLRAKRRRRLDGIGVPLALADPQITVAGTTQDVLTVLDRLLLP